MATADEDPSIFITISSDCSSEIQGIIVKMRDDFRKEDKDGLKFLTEVCFDHEELKSLDGVRGCLCDILEKYKLPTSFVAKVLQEIGRKDLVSKYLLREEFKSWSPTARLRLLEEHLSDERTLLNDDKLDPIIMLFRFTLYRIAQAFSREEEDDFKKFIYEEYRNIVHKFPRTNSVEEMLHVLEEEELLTPDNTEIFDTFLAKFPGHDELGQEVRRHLENFKAKFTELIIVADGVGSLNIFDKCPSSPILECYNMSSKIRGYCVILVQTEGRTGADKEPDKLEETFRKLRFKVKVHKNFTSTEMFPIMQTYQKMDHSDYDSFACFIIGHGQMSNKKDYLLCSDKKVVNVGEVLSCMNPPTLHNKPKLFFINICRYDPEDGQILPGLESQQPTDAAAERSIRSDSSFSNSFEGDVLKAYSTACGAKSNRSTKEGAWYITELCDVLETYKDRLNLMHMLMKVHQRVCKRKNPGLNLSISQVPQCCHQLNKLVYFRDSVI